MAWWWNRKRQSDIELLGVLMRGQSEAATQRTTLEMKRQELEMRRMELEFENLERLGEEKRRQAEANQKLREQRKEWASKAREVLKQKRNLQGGGTIPSACRVCANPGEPSLQANEIAWHYQGHPAQQRA